MKSHRRGQKDNNNRLLGINKQFCIPYGAESTASICRGHDSDCIEVNSHQVAIFRVKHLNLDIERTRRDVISLVLLIIPLVFFNTPILLPTETEHKTDRFLGSKL